MKSMSKIACFALFFALLQTTQAQPQTVINNNISAPQQQNGPAPCSPANQNNIYDPRVPPAGVYTTRNGDGSSQTLYTTGEKKPYIVDNNCNSGASAAQPQVFVQPRDPRH